MIHVFGHINPDSDTVCTAYMAARWLTIKGRNAQAFRLGELNRETNYIFRHAGLTPPPLLDDSLAGKDVWLVDFTEPAQGPASLNESNVVGIIDHHRLGGLITQLPPEVWIKPVGSSATLLWQLMTPTTRHEISPSEAILLLGAALSDTVALRSPTTTDEDRQAVDELCSLATVDREDFTRNLLTAKTDIVGLNADELLNKDSKMFDISGNKVLVAQLELYSLDQAEPLIDELKSAMEQRVTTSEAGLVVLMLTDISAECSRLYFAGPALTDNAPCTIAGMLSRKKQLLPWLHARLG
ncbi:manganese-dependent inorganic pyrophosphatase [Buttiauxella sp. BIGb0471]|uniref:manganese-dependent inorganic pyrophosphatase n=1 Tax=Buttiauxella sp. BIGb0471 TaxID=2940597 RepID=UPI002169666E|nr:manganese-dependent inorganic pyrophosphatase [Buttiauxella sp. BIGb0471]MCS3600892.1 manganese-dependent inorganic pyrophosphatase [Buttiauxella sp. BIGb0471]